MSKQAINLSTARTGATAYGRAAPNRRSTTRSPLVLLGRMQTLHGTRTVRLRDVSRWGSKVEGAPPVLGAGSEAILKCDELDVFATVRWVRGELCGIRFDTPVGEATLQALQATSERLAEQSVPPAAS